MPVKLSNNATSRLAASITTGSTNISVQPGDGGKFPALAAGQTFPVTLIKADGQLEICRCTARAGDVLTIERGKEGTLAKAFSAGDRVELRLTNGALEEKIGEARVITHRGPGDSSWITTVPEFYIDACAGGGGGGGSSGWVGPTIRYNGGGGGAGQSFVAERVTIPVGTLVTWSVGIGGKGGAGGGLGQAGLNGQPGGQTIIVLHTAAPITYILASGGGGMGGGTGGPALGGSGDPAGGSGFGGTVPSADSWQLSGAGGSSSFGGGGPGVANLSGGAAGIHGGGYGSGGGGSASPSGAEVAGQPAGDGHPGYLKLYW